MMRKTKDYTKNIRMLELFILLLMHKIKWGINYAKYSKVCEPELVL